MGGETVVNLNVWKSSRGEPATTLYSQESDLISLDVAGFSKLTERIVETHGSGAAEYVHTLLEKGFCAVSQTLRPHGFELVDTLGDGVMLARPQDATRKPASSLSSIVATAERVFLDASGLRVRGAGVSGMLRLCRVGGWNNQWQTMATGPAVEALHASLRARRSQEADAFANQSGVALPRVALHALRPNDQAGEIRRLTVVFAVLDVTSLPQDWLWTGLPQLCAAAQQLAAAFGGWFEKVTHDDKGVLLHLNFQKVMSGDKSEAEAALDSISEIDRLLRSSGVTAKFGLAQGQLYRGRLTIEGHDVTIVHGPAVNLSAKLASLGSYAVNCCPSTLNAVRHRFSESSAFFEQSLAGGLHSVGFSLQEIRKNEIPSTSGGAALGRQEQLDSLIETLARHDGQTSLYLQISGVPGIGKTRFLQSASQQLVEHPNVFWVRGAPSRLNDFQFLWRELFSTLQATNGASEFEALVHRHLAAAGIDTSLHHVLLEMAGMMQPAATRSARSLSGYARQEVLNRSIVVVLAGLYGHSKIVLVVDDIQWIDSASLQTLRRVLSEVSALRVIASARDDFQDPLLAPGSAVSVQRIVLTPLDEEVVRNIACGICEDLRVHPDALGMICDLSAGSPFRAEQLSLLVRDQGVDALAKLAEPSDKPSETIAKVVDERLDELTTFETALLRMAAVLDQPITADALGLVMSRELSRDAYEHALQSVAQKRLLSWTHSAESTQTLSVQHRILAQAAVARTPPSQLAALHSRAARYFSSLRGSNARVHAFGSLIAYHWKHAHSPLRAAISYAHAADAALNAGGDSLATECYTLALEQIQQSEKEIATFRVANWLAGRSIARWSAGDIPHALKDADNSIRVLDQGLAGRAHSFAWAGSTVARLRRFAALFPGLALVSLPRSARQPIMALSAIRAEIALMLGSLPMLLGSSLTMAALSGDIALRARTRARAYGFLGHAASLMGLTGLAKRTWNAAITAGLSVQDGVAQSHGHLGEALWHVSHGRWNDARQHLHEARKLCGEFCDPFYFRFIETLLALSAYFEGSWEASHAHFVHLHETALKQKSRFTEAWGLYGQAEALLVPERFAEAETLLAQAVPIVFSLPDKQSQIICLGLRTHLEFGMKRYDRALACAEETLKFAQSLPAVNFGSLEGYAAPAEVLARLALSDSCDEPLRKRAGALCKDALKQLVKFCTLHPIGKPRLSLCHALIAKGNGDVVAMMKHLQSGHAEAQRVNMRHECNKLEQLMRTV